MELNRSLKARHLTMISVGGVIGAGFSSAGAAIARTGPSVVLAYLIGGVITLFIMLLLAEMAVARPVSGSFDPVMPAPPLAPRCGFYHRLDLLAGLPDWSGVGSHRCRHLPEPVVPGVPVWLFCPVIASSLTAINMVGVHFSVRWSSG